MTYKPRSIKPKSSPPPPSTSKEQLKPSSYPLPLFARILQYSSLMRPSRHGIGLSFWPPPMARYTYFHHTP
ncbi:hypothetical protein PGTUg99_001331 [Puccinia graminis f. sp. tritici]|uniref:Uncharacterized protein n=1 Tax=Puccinia graminis f. sp. tritici TaxID=56615 RepID=A0A5B0RGN9_PUCGR|nr:hypothetical protein PGTUg99_001331 [Puccinia graminis f. sp. tritici]